MQQDDVADALTPFFCNRYRSGCYLLALINEAPRHASLTRKQPEATQRAGPRSCAGAEPADVPNRNARILNEAYPARKKCDTRSRQRQA